MFYTGKLRILFEHPAWGYTLFRRLCTWTRFFIFGFYPQNINYIMEEKYIICKKFHLQFK